VFRRLPGLRAGGAGAKKLQRLQYSEGDPVRCLNADLIVDLELGRGIIRYCSSLTLHWELRWSRFTYCAFSQATRTARDFLTPDAGLGRITRFVEAICDEYDEFADLDIRGAALVKFTLWEYSQMYHTFSSRRDSHRDTLE